MRRFATLALLIWAGVATVGWRRAATADDPAVGRAALEVARARGGQAARLRAPVRVPVVEVDQGDVDAELWRLAELVAGGDQELAGDAARSLARSRDPQGFALLAQLAREGDLTARRAAIAALGEVGTPESRALLAELALAGDPRLVDDVVRALVADGDAEAIETVKWLASGKGNGRAQQAALWGLRDVGGPDIDALMLEVAQGGRPDARRVALEHMIANGHEQALPLVVAMAQTGSRQERYQAVNLLGQARTPEAAAALKQIARESGGQLRAQALSQLANLDEADPEVTALLGESMRSGRSSESSSAVWALARSKDPAARALLLEAAAGADDPQLAGYALNALSELSGPDVDVVLAGAMQAEDPRVRAAAVQAMARSGGPGALAAAQAALADPDPQVSSAAVSALSQLDDPAARALLRDAAVAPGTDPSARNSAIWALSQDASPESQTLLIDLSRDADPGVRGQALSALAQRGTPEAMQALATAARDDDPGTRAAALNALRSSPEDPQAEALLLEGIWDADDQVATAAVYGAGYDLGDAGCDAVAALLGDPDAPAGARQAAAQVLKQRGGRWARDNQAAIDAALAETYTTTIVLDHPRSYEALINGEVEF